MKIKSIHPDEVHLSQNTEVSLKLAGNTAEVMFASGKNKKCPIKNLSKDAYVDLSTGEIKERKHSKNRYQSPKSVRKSINSLMDLIRCNATNPANCKWITLTYREEMTDSKRVFKDNKAFLRKLRSYLKKRKLSESQSDFKFIAVAEPQGERHGNAWHIHLILIFSGKAPFISNEDIAELWGNGYTDTHAVYDGDGLALYFRAYLSDVEYVVESKENEDIVDGVSDTISEPFDFALYGNPAYEGEDAVARESTSKHEPTNIVTKVVDGVSKKFIKGERLKFYPVGMPLYSCSRGMKRPSVEKIKNKEVKDKLRGYYMSFRQSFRIGEGEKTSVIDKRYFQRKGTGKRYADKKSELPVKNKSSKCIELFSQLKKVCDKGLDGNLQERSCDDVCDNSLTYIIQKLQGKKQIE